MAIRVSGLISGLDTDSIVQELVSAYSKKKEKYEKAQTKQEWKMDSWKTMNSKIYGFYTSSLSDMRMSTAYSMKTSSVSNSNVAKVTASSNAVNGTQKLKVNKLASSAYMTGGVVKLSDDKNDTGNKKVTGSTALSDMGIEAGSKIAVNDKEIQIADGMTVNQLIAKLKDAGVTASFDENNQRFFVSAKTSGAAGEFTITANNADGLGALQKLGLFATHTTEKDANGKYVETAEMEKYRSFLEKGSGATEEQKAVAKAVLGETSYDKTLAEYEQTIKDYQDSVAFKAKYESNLEIVANYESWNDIVTGKKDGYTADEMKKYNDLLYDTVTNEDGTEEKVAKYTDEEIAAMRKFNQEHGGLEESDPDYPEYMKNAEILTAKSMLDDYDTAKSVVEDEANIEAYETASDFVDDTDNQIELAKAETYIKDNADAYAEAKMAVSALAMSDYESNSDVARISGQDAEIELNGATFSSSTGTFSINGLLITATQVTGADEEVSITTSTDTQAIYDKIKSFLSKYNELIKEMDTAYNAASAGDYEPLTDDEKEDMSDKEIEKWETKIKDSLLRRDSTLGNTSSAMKSLMNASFDINGKTYSLATFGISTGGYFTSDTNERGCLHIDGDKDDDTTSGNVDKLMAAINEDPEAVATFFQKLSSGVYNDLTKRMATSSISSVYTIYNDKQMSSEYSEYKDKISQWQEKLDYYEEFYYKKFSAMETALSKLQSSTQNLSSLFGS